jgi:hypothetical protein
MRRNKKKLKTDLELKIKVSVFLVLLLAIALRQETRDMSNNIAGVYHPALNFISGFKALFTQFTTLIYFYKGIY